MELPTPEKSEALASLITSIGNEDSFAADVSDIDREIPDDPLVYGHDENFDLDKWHLAREARIRELIEVGEFRVEFIDREVDPMMIFEMVRFGNRFLYYAVSKHAVDTARATNPDYANLTDEYIAISILDRYYETIYRQLFPEGDKYNQIHIVTSFTDTTSDKLLIKFTNRSPRIRGYAGRGGEQRIEFFIYDTKAKRTVPIILSEINI